MTGAAATIGSAAMTAPRPAGRQCKVAARAPGKIESRGVEAVAFDRDEVDTYLPAMQGADADPGIILGRRHFPATA